MKKININTKLSIIAGVILSMNIGITNAQIFQNQNQPVIRYLGLSFNQSTEQQENEIKINDLNDLLSNQIISKSIKNENSVTEIRKDALKEIAGALGASSGLAYKMKHLKKETDENAARLDKIFDFSKMTIDNGVLAPILTEGLANYAQESDDQVRIQDKIFKIEAPARFVSVYPTWRDYLRFNFPKFELPEASYLPQNDAEKKIWDDAVKEGWKKGVNQANQIYEMSYSKLERDYLGMIKFKILLEEGLITPTVIAKQNLGVTGGGREMSINDQIFRITDHSALNPDYKSWNVEYPITNRVNGVLK